MSSTPVAHTPVSPKVSVVISTYQRASTLRGVVAELLDQSLRDIEVFVMDDGSTDETANLMIEIRDPRLRYFRMSHLGVPEIVNAGMKQCSGEYIMICHDHDRYDHHLLKKLARLLDRYPTAGFAFCGYSVLDSSATVELRRDIHDFPECMDGKTFLRTQLLPRLDSCVSALSMVRRSALNGRFMDSEIGGSADVDLWHRLSSTWDVVYSQEALIGIRSRDESSRFFGAGGMLTRQIIRAKKRYLPYAGDSPAQNSLVKKWMRAVDVTVLWMLLRAVETHTSFALEETVELAREHGSPYMAALVSGLRLAPAWLTMPALRFARRVRRLRRVHTLTAPKEPALSGGAVGNGAQIS